MSETKQLETWAVVELMGRIKIAGKVTEESHFGVVMLRLDIPEVDGRPEHTEFYGGTALYRVTPCDEQIARLVLQQNHPAPIVYFQLPQPQHISDMDDMQDEAE